MAINLEDRPIYELDDLIQKLEDIRMNKLDKLSIPNALLCLSYEIRGIKTLLEMRYRGKAHGKRAKAERD